MLETMRQLGQEHLRRTGRAETVSSAAAGWARSLARAAEPHLVQGDARWLDRLDGELPNIRAVFSTAADDPALAAIGVEIVGRLSRFWFLRTMYSEGSSWAQRLLAAAPDAPPADRARALSTVGFLRGEMAVDRDGIAVATAALDKSVALNREIGDEIGLATSLNVRGRVGFIHRDRCRADLDESLALGRRHGAHGVIFLDLLLLATWDFAYGRPLDAAARAEEALAMARQMAGPQAIAHALELSCWVHLERGDFALGQQALIESLDNHRQVGNTGCACHALESTAWLLGASGRTEDAALVGRSARDLRARYHAPVAPYEAFIGANALRWTTAQVEMRSIAAEPSTIEDALHLASELLAAP
jgi:hypothetical protein